TTYEAVDLRGGQSMAVTARHAAVPGVYRASATLVAGRGDLPVPGRMVVEQTFACSPARLARDLPDNWPIAAHVSDQIPPLPGFKWYRYFSLWSENNPAREVYRWDGLDDIFKQVK